MTQLRTYTELTKRTDFMARFRYAQLGGERGAETFGYDRYLNQQFYGSHAWRRIRDWVIVRDDARDLGVPSRVIHGRVLVHHMNPIRVQDLTDFNPDILDPEYLICVSERTHNAIHFGDESQLAQEYVERRPGDTTLW